MQITTSNDLNNLTKLQIIRIARELGWRGNDGVASKGELIAYIANYAVDAINLAIEACEAKHPDLFNSSSNTTRKVSDMQTVSHAPAASPAPEAAATQLAEALRALMPAAPLDRSAVTEIASAIVDARLGDAVAEYSDKVDAVYEKVSGQLAELVKGIEPRVEKVYIRPDATEYKVEGKAHAQLDKVVKLASLRQNILLVGPAGCGKTHLAEQTANALGLEFGSISCTGGMSESQLLGWLLPVGESGRFEYVMSEFVRLYENGGLFLLDEGDAADANVMLVINQALANGGFHVPQARRFVKRHKDFVCMMAANTFGHGGDMVYAGREKLDGATLDRFRTAIVYMTYDADLEKALIAPEVLAWGKAIRAKIDSLKLRRVMSTRAMIGFTQQAAAFGWGKREWEESFFADWSRDELAKVAA